MRSSNPYLGALVNNEGRHPFIRSREYDRFSDSTFRASRSGSVQTAVGQYDLQNEPNYGRYDVADRPLTIDDVVTKTAITLSVLIFSAAVTYFVSLSQPQTGLMLTFLGVIASFVLVLVSAFSKKYGSPVVTLLYAVFEGLGIGGISFLFAHVTVGRAAAGALIAQAVIGTIGVFVGMLVVYKTGAIRVTPKFTRFMVSAMIGVFVLMLVNFFLSFFSHDAGPLRDGGPLAYLFSLVCIGLAALSFLLDFDQADTLVRNGAPARTAWGIALGLTITLVWLYLEILRFLSYLQRD